LIATGLLPFAPETQNVRAGRLLLARIRELAVERQNFGFETTLSGRSYFRLLRQLKADGYRVEVFSLWLPDADAAVLRVVNRVRHGGHNIAEPIIRRWFELGNCNLFQLYRPLFDAWRIYNASRLPPSVITEEAHGKLTVFEPELYDAVQGSVKE